jgi:glycosyltransferase involved in cell wall biosynthesis
MHVGLNLVYLVPGETGGMETYAHELVTALSQADPALKLTAFVNSVAAASGEGSWSELAEVVTVPVNARRRAEWVRGEQQLLPGLAQRSGIDVLHSLASTAPVRGAFARVVTIHDLIYRRYPEAHFGLRSLGMRMLVPLAARRSHRVIAVSESTKRDLIELLRLDAGKIDVVPQGVRIAPPGAVTAEAELRRRYGLSGRRLLLSVSAKRPHKNIAALLDALARIPNERRPVLLVPGYETPHEDELHQRAQQLGIAGDVRFAGWLDPADLEGLYAAADLFVFPSLYEGFGLPVLEAMARGAPVVSSNRSSLPEVAGDAALLVDPEDPAAMAQAIERVLSDAKEAERLRAAGREQAARFSWDATARGTLASYERALDARAGARGRKSARG